MCVKMHILVFKEEQRSVDNFEIAPGLELDRGHRGHCLPLLGFGLDALRPLSTLGYSLLLVGLGAFLLLCPVALVPP